MQVEWPPVTFNPEDFNPRNILESYFDVGVVLSQSDVILRAALVTIGLVELLRAAQEIQAQTFNSSALIYLTNILERHLNRRTA